ncbi:MAG: ADP-ribosylglycohydrolase family protein [Lachnospiraceae bacterium]|nr:ADP-ribosylglycohydrolase family protein [Lachnospiraceae bacterium]
MNKNYYIDAIMGVVIGDALGCPVQFMRREDIKERGPVTDMEGYGTYNMPAGTWTDDSSMTLATLASIHDFGTINLEDIMDRFLDWYKNGAYTPYGKAFDMGITCSVAIEKYERTRDVYTCGGLDERSNGNGSLMRIMPACLYAYYKKIDDKSAIKIIHEISGLTHNHLRSKIGCGLYYFCVCEILDGKGSLTDRLQKGIDRGFNFYEKDINNRTDLNYYSRLKDLSEFALIPENEIKSSGYIVDSLEAAIWSIINTDTFKSGLLKAVNLGDDSDTVAAIAGGLAGLYYGLKKMPASWIEIIPRAEWIMDLCSVHI